MTASKVARIAKKYAKRVHIWRNGWFEGEGSRIDSCIPAHDGTYIAKITWGMHQNVYEIIVESNGEVSACRTVKYGYYS